MPYYQGDYYRGDYYRGDPFIGGLIKSIGRGIKGAATGFITGGPIGAISGGVSGAFGSTTPAPVPSRITQDRQLQIPSREISIGPGGSIYKRTETRFGAEVSPAMAPGACADGCPKGFHLDKATKSRCVRNRRMNVANPKALRRAIRRNRGFVKTFRKAASTVGLSVYAKRAPKMRKGR